MAELKPCRCGATPVQETESLMLGKIKDGGYSVTQGRYVCPVCGYAPDWGLSYCVEYSGGWEKNAMVWNKKVGDNNG